MEGKNVMEGIRKGRGSIVNNFEVTILILISAALTVILRTMPLFVRIPENNRIINKFFEALPYAVLTLLVFPGMFTSAGNTGFDIIKVSIGIGVITFLSLKRYGLGIVITASMFIIFIFDIIKVMIR